MDAFWKELESLKFVVESRTDACPHPELPQLVVYSQESVSCDSRDEEWRKTHKTAKGLCWFRDQGCEICTEMQIGVLLCGGLFHNNRVFELSGKDGLVDVTKDFFEDAHFGDIDADEPITNPYYEVSVLFRKLWIAVDNHGLRGAQDLVNPIRRIETVLREMSKTSGPPAAEACSEVNVDVDGATNT